jgi:hypothetical protein
VIVYVLVVLVIVYVLVVLVIVMAHVRAMPLVMVIGRGRAFFF